jgi:DNA polymerase I-like protein with 3'-5' exonuclease and polymerase domains
MDWAELRNFAAVWAIDFEFHQPDGERPDVICMVAKDVLSGREMRLDADQLRPHHPPFDVEDALYVAYAAKAEMACFEALEWPTAQYILDLNVEFSHLRNDGAAHPKKLYNALEYFGGSTIGSAEKVEMQNLAIRGGPFTGEEKRQLIEYCASDVYALERLLPLMAPHLDLLYALVRGRFTACVAKMDHIGVPIDMELFQVLRSRWGDIQHVLIDDIQNTYDLFDGYNLKQSKFDAFIDRLDIPYWPRSPISGRYRRDEDTLRDMAAIYPPIRRLKDGMAMLGQVRKLSLAVGKDGRNRSPLWPFGTKTGRCAPSTTKFIFNLPAWLRSLIRPEPGYALAYIDFSQEEPAIAACLSGDQGMMDGYRVGGDLYVDFAQRAGAIPSHLPAKEAKTQFKSVRDTYKICLLASMYDQQEYSLSSRIGKSVLHARYLLRQLQLAYPRFVAWIDNEIDIALLSGRMQTRMRWSLKTRKDTRDTTLLNFPMQATGAEILQRAVYMVQQAGVQVCCPVHDAILIIAKEEDIAHHARLAKEAMEKASADLLSGFWLFSDGWREDDYIIYPNRYTDPRGKSVWEVISPYLDKGAG